MCITYVLFHTHTKRVSFVRCIYLSCGLIKAIYIFTICCAPEMSILWKQKHCQITAKWNHFHLTNLSPSQEWLYRGSLISFSIRLYSYILILQRLPGVSLPPLLLTVSFPVVHSFFRQSHHIMSRFPSKTTSCLLSSILFLGLTSILDFSKRLQLISTTSSLIRP